jgi:SET domain-containing protein
MRLKIPNKIYIDNSPIHGWGVFAKETIYEGEVIEEAPIYDLNIPKNEPSSLMIDYRFNWPQGSGGAWTKQVIAWGYGSLYNHSDNNNAYWRSNLERDTFEFVATKQIEIGEEIFVYYGGVNYWQDGRTNTKVI